MKETIRGIVSRTLIGFEIIALVVSLPLALLLLIGALFSPHYSNPDGFQGIGSDVIKFTSGSTLIMAAIGAILGKLMSSKKLFKFSLYSGLAALVMVSLAFVFRL